MTTDAQPDSVGPVPRSDPVPPREESLSHNGDFLRLWGGETLSQLGSQVSTLALPLTAVIVLHVGAAQVGLLATAQYAPILLVSPFAGHWFDRFRCRPILIATHFGRAVIISLIPLAYALDLLSVPLLLAVAFATGTLSAVFDVGYVTYLPKLVTPDRLTAANARLESTYSIAGAGGPGLGGVLVQVFTAPVAVLADAVTYLVAGVLGLSIRHRESLPRAERQPLWPALRQGVSLLWRHPVLRPVLAQSAAFNLLGQVVFTLFLLYGVEQLRLASSTLGVILSVSCLGGLAGAALASRAERRMGTGRVMAWSMAVGSLSLAAIPAAAGSVVAVVAALIAGLILHELGLAVFNVHSLNVRARLVPAEMLGRVTAAWRLVSTGMLALNGVLASVLGELFGVRAAMAVAVGVLALCCLAFLLGPVASWTLEESPEGGKDGAS